MNETPAASRGRGFFVEGIMSTKHKCTTASHRAETKTEFTSKEGRLRPWTEAGLLIGECTECGSTLSWPKEKNPPRRNPSTDPVQRDLFGGETPVFRALSDLSHDEIVALPRRAFTDAEWAELDDDTQEEIYEADGESEELVQEFVDAFVQRYKWAIDPSHLDYSSAEEYFEEFLREHARSGDLIEIADHAGYDASEWIDEQVALGFSEDQARKALEEALEDSNVYSFIYDTSEYGEAFFKDKVSESFWMDSHDVENLIEGKPSGRVGNMRRAMFRDEIERACGLVEKEANHIGPGLSLGIDDVVDKKGRAKEINVYDVAEWWVDADPNWDKVTERALENLSEEDPLGPVAGEPPPEERVLYRWKDGFYVQDLTPQELPAEGKNMGMCVGRPDMGYGRAVRNGEIKILSLRRPSGKPLFTFEAALNDKGEIVDCSQIAGKANREPGFDLGKDGPNELIKKDEVERVLDFVIELGLDPPADCVNREGHPSLGPALNWIIVHQGDDLWARKMVEKVKAASSHAASYFAQTNPARRRNPSCTAGDHAGCTGFCVPYRRRR